MRDEPPNATNRGALDTSNLNEVALLTHVIQAVFAAAYAEGQFDQANGFAGDSLESVAKNWMNEHASLLSVPVDVTAFVSTLASEAAEMRRRSTL